MIQKQFGNVYAIDLYTVFSYTLNREIAETSIFTKEITHILTDDEYKELQNFLVAQPQSGAVIKGSGGLRKSKFAAYDIYLRKK